ncbi:MAG: hypothetical protein ACYTAN_12780 [Planctomycetota bacterium]|jgi:hypothetical protein
MILDRHIRSVSASKVNGLWHVNPWGRTLYVNSAHLRSSDVGPDGLDKDHPLNTLVKAISYAQAGDMIVVGPGHTETISTALTILVGDLYIRGVGVGLRRPKFTFGATTASMALGVPGGVILENLHFAPGIDSVVFMVLVVGTDCQIIDCYVSDTAAYQALTAIALNATADRTNIVGLRAFQPNAGAAQCVSISSADLVEVRDCYIAGDYSAACCALTAAAVDVLIDHNKLNNLNAVDVCIEGFAGATGLITDNRCRIATDVQTTWINTLGALSLGENYGVNDDGETGVLIGTPSA